MLSWISQTFQNIYITPIDRIHWAMFLLPACWLAAAFLAGISEKTGRAFRILSLIAAIVFALIVFYMTVLGREGGKREVYLVPLYSFREAKQHPELYRQLTMNIFLFEPLGCAAPYAAECILRIRGKMNDSASHKELQGAETVRDCYPVSPMKAIEYAILCCLSLSVLIEACQGIFGLGRIETDDVIMNLLGALIGIACYGLHVAVFRMYRTIRSGTWRFS